MLPEFFSVNNSKFWRLPNRGSTPFGNEGQYWCTVFGMNKRNHQTQLVRNRLVNGNFKNMVMVIALKRKLIVAVRVGCIA